MQNGLIHLWVKCFFSHCRDLIHDVLVTSVISLPIFADKLHACRTVEMHLLQHIQHVYIALLQTTLKCETELELLRTDYMLTSLWRILVVAMCDKLLDVRSPISWPARVVVPRVLFLVSMAGKAPSPSEALEKLEQQLRCPACLFGALHPA